MIAGIGVSMVAGPIGCFIIWKRMSYLGDTMAHSALLGVAFSVFFELNIILGVFFVAILIGILLFLFQTKKHLSNDAILGTLSHASLAIGVLIMPFLSTQESLDLIEMSLRYLMGVGLKIDVS